MLRSHQIALLEEKKEPEGGGAAAFNEEQQKAIGQIVNSAITSHEKRRKPLAEELKAVNWAEALKLDELLDVKIAKLLEETPETEEEPGKKPGKKSAESDAVQRQLQELATKLENSEKARAAADQARSDAETQRSMDRATGELRNLLQPKVRAELLDLLVRDLATNQKLLKLGEGGAATLTVKRAPFKGAPEQEEDVALAEAVPVFLASDAAKVFLPAPGSNTEQPKRGGGAPRVSTTPGGVELPKDPAARTIAQLTALGIDPNDI